MTHDLPHWYLLGAGNMGTHAAACLIDASHRLSNVRDKNRPALEKLLRFGDGRAPRRLRLPVIPRRHIAAPIRHLLVACKAPYTTAALQGLPLADDVFVLRLQNGIGSLDGLLPDGAQLIEAVTTNAVKGAHPEHEIVAENATWMGGVPQPPAWFDTLTPHWPGLTWCADIAVRQWRKLVANAVINPLTALYDVPNGALPANPDRRADMARLAAEADAVLRRLDEAWPGDSLAYVEAVARNTASNTSSMRADLQRGAVTEIDAINGWLLRQARGLGMTLPAHEAVVAAIKSS